MEHVRRLTDAEHIDHPGVEVWAYSDRSDFPQLSASRIRVKDQHGRVYSDASDRVYLVLRGSGWFWIDGTRTEVGESDVVVLPKNTVYDYGGDLELFLVHSPAFLAAGDHHLDAASHD